MTTIAAAERLVECIASTGAAARRDGFMPAGQGYGPYIEELAIEGADTSRIVGGPVLIDHQMRSDLQIGIVQAVRTEIGKIIATLKISADPRPQAILREIRDGTRTAVSVGYNVETWEKRGGDKRNEIPVYRAVRWTPIEISVVPAGLDPGARFRSSSTPDDLVRYRTMTVIASPGAEVAPVTSTAPPAPDPIAEAVRIERERTTGITLACRTWRLDPKHGDRLINDGVPLQAARDRLTELWAASQEGTTVDTHVHLVRDHTDPDAIRAGMADALAYRLSGGRVSLPEGSRQYVGSSLIDMARGLQQARGTRQQWLNHGDVVGNLFRASGGMHSTSDFALLTASTSNRALLDRFEQLAPALLPIAKRQTAPDFKSISRIRFGEGSELARVNEHGEVTRGTVKERGESYTIATYAKVFAFTRQLIVNDDLGALQDFISEIGRKAAVLLGDTLWNALNTSALMSDGVSLFSSTHGNLASTPSTVDATNLSIGRIGMRAQTGIDGAVINATPKFLITGAAKETAAETVLAALNPASTSDVNVFSGKLTLLVEPRIAGNTWFLAADPAVMHAIEYAELDGTRPMGGTGPAIEVREGFDVEGLEVKVRYDLGAGVVAFQPLWKNAGA